MLRFLLGLIFGIILVPSGGLVAYLSYGKVPVAVSDPAFPYEQQLVHLPLGARIEREMVGTHMLPDPANLTAGARIYTDRCAVWPRPPQPDCCYRPAHVPRRTGLCSNRIATTPMLWAVKDDPPGETYWKIENGIRLTGMPSPSKLEAPTITRCGKSAFSSPTPTNQCPRLSSSS